jgi:hypothetical protein
LGDRQSADAGLPKTRNRRGGTASVAPSLGREVVEETFLLIQGGQRGAVQTLGDGLLEHLLAGRDQVEKNGGTTRAQSIDGDPVRVTAELVDVFLDPFQGLNLIQETNIIIRNTPASEVRVGEESERGETIVDGDNDDFWALVDPVIVGQSGGVSEDIAPPVNVE